MSTVPTPTTTLTLDEINPASFDFWLRDDMMGVPEGDRAKLLDLTNRLLAGGDKAFGGTREALLQAAGELREYGLWLGKKRLEHPENDLATVLVHAEVDGEAMPPEDLGPFFLLLIAAGNETTRTAISQGMWAFTQFPHEKRQWLADLEATAEPEKRRSNFIRGIKRLPVAFTPA